MALAYSWYRVLAILFCNKKSWVINSDMIDNLIFLIIICFTKILEFGIKKL